MSENKSTTPTRFILWLLNFKVRQRKEILKSCMSAQPGKGKVNCHFNMWMGTEKAIKTTSVECQK